MKITKLAVAVLVVAGLAVTAIPATAAGGGPGLAPGAGATALTPLSVSEVDTLKWMREEEKLARDVYLALNLYYPAEIFTTIAASEQRHFDALGQKLELYGIEDPAQEAIGVFTEPDLQDLYYDLLELGMASYVEALKVGVIIEETDLTDLEYAIAGTDSVPLTRTYAHLLTGSARHLAAFTRLLATAGVILD